MSKLSRTGLRRLIKEEMHTFLREADGEDAPVADAPEPAETAADVGDVPESGVLDLSSMGDGRDLGRTLLSITRQTVGDVIKRDPRVPGGWKNMDASGRGVLFQYFGWVKLSLDNAGDTAGAYRVSLSADLTTTDKVTLSYNIDESATERGKGIIDQLFGVLIDAVNGDGGGSQLSFHHAPQWKKGDEMGPGGQPAATQEYTSIAFGPDQSTSFTLPLMMTVS